ncbi:HAMP domain-containing histidine kinase, partial [bacterium]|nr:HAMP domain-containing histidine kinase [bacterium]
ELKAPLSAVESYLNIIQKRAIGPQLEQYDRIIERCLARMRGMRKLVVDLLDLTRIESGEMKRDLVEVDLWTILDCVIESNLPLAQETGITIGTKGLKPLKMVAERKEIEIILNNLISNAIKYNRPEGKVEVALETQKGHIVITVSDTGIGMTQKETNLLFNDFYRVKTAKTQNIPGSGLGLAIIKRIIALYQGSVNVSSKPDGGSTFTIKLPVANTLNKP